MTHQRLGHHTVGLSWGRRGGGKEGFARRGEGGNFNKDTDMNVHHHFITYHQTLFFGGYWVCCQFIAQNLVKLNEEDKEADEGDSCVCKHSDTWARESTGPKPFITICRRGHCRAALSTAACNRPDKRYKECLGL
jgi:hypothetical protein